MQNVIFLVSWNGYDDGQRVALPTLEAQRLIDARICVLDNPVPSRPTGPDTSPVPGDGNFEFEDWAAFLAARDAIQLVEGRRYTVLQPLVAGGTHGLQFIWTTATGIRPAPGWQPLIITDQVVTQGPSATELLYFSVRPPLGLLAGCRAVQLHCVLDRDQSDTNVSTARWRCGNDGAVSDAEIARVLPTAARRQINFPTQLAFLSATSVAQRPISAGVSASIAINSGAESSTARDAPVTIPNLTTNQVWLSATFNQAGSPVAAVSRVHAAIWIA